MANAMTYIANLGKSVTYSAVDKIKEMNPALSDLADQNAELGKVLYESVKDLKGTSLRAKKYISESSVGEFAREYKKAFFEDIKTGKFYNRERDSEMLTRGAGSLLSDMDDMGGDPFADIDNILDDNNTSGGDWDDVISEDDKHMSKMVDTVGGKITNGVAMATGQAAEYQVEAYRDGVKKSLQHAEYISDKINAGMAGVNSTIAKLVEFNDKAMKVHINNSQTFYTEMTKSANETNKLLKQLVDIQTNMYNPQQEQKKGSSGTPRFSDITSGGMPSLKEYMKNVTANLNTETGGLMDMNKVFGDDSNLLLTFAANPLKFIPDFIVNKAVPKAIENSVKGLNETLSGLFAGEMLKINKQRNDFDTNEGLMHILNVLGINMGIKGKGSLKNNKYNKGAIPWDGEAKMALTRVIPDYLAKILAATTGTSERFYDYETGTYRDLSLIDKEMDNMYRKYSDAAASDIINYMTQEIKKIDFTGNKEMYDQLIEDMHNMFETAYSNGQIIDFDKKDPEKINTNELGITEDSAKILIPLLQNIVDPDGLNKRSMMMTYNRKILENRDAHNRYMKNLEQNPTSITRNLNSGIGFDEYINTKRIHNVDYVLTDPRDIAKMSSRRGGIKGGLGMMNNLFLVKDEYNKNIFWYLQRFAQEFETIRTKGLYVNGGYIDTTANNSQENSQFHISNNETEPIARDTTLVGLSGIVGNTYRSFEDNMLRNNLRDEESFDRSQTNKAKNMKKNAKKHVEDMNPMLYNDIYNTEDLRDGMKKYSAYLKTNNDFRKYQQTTKGYKDREKKYKNSILGAIMESEDVDDTFKNLVMGVDDLARKPADFLTGIIGKVDKRLYDLIYGDEDDDKLSPKSFMGNLISRLTFTFGHFGEYLRDEILDPLKDSLFGTEEDSFKNKMKEFFKDEDLQQFLKDAFGDKIEFVKDAFKEKYTGFLEMLNNKENQSDKINYADEILKQAKSENAIKEAKAELGGAMPAGATFKLDENGMPIKNSKGGYEFTVDPHILANKANRINAFTDKQTRIIQNGGNREDFATEEKWNNAKAKSRDNIISNTLKNNRAEISNAISSYKASDNYANMQDNIEMYKNAKVFANSDEEAKMYDKKINALNKKANEGVHTAYRNSILDSIEANGGKTKRQFGKEMQNVIEKYKERIEGQSDLDKYNEDTDARINYITNKLKQNSIMPAKERKAISKNIKNIEKEIKANQEKLENPDLTPDEKATLKTEISAVEKQIKDIEKQLKNPNLTEDKVKGLNDNLETIKKDLTDKTSKLQNQKLSDEDRKGIINTQMSLNSRLRSEKSKLKNNKITFLSNDEKKALYADLNESDRKIGYLNRRLNDEENPIEDAVANNIREQIEELRKNKKAARSRLNSAASITIEDRDSMINELKSLKAERQNKNDNHLKEQNYANFRAIREMFDLGMSGQDIEDKGFGGYMFRSDRFSNNLNDSINNIKSKMEALKDRDGNITNPDKYNRLARRLRRLVKDQAKFHNMQGVYNTGLFRKGIDKFAYGGEITKTGIAAVSEGELIIPSQYNPFYKGSNNKLSQLAKEEQAKKNFTGFLDSLKNLRADKINGFQDGGANNQQTDIPGVARVDNIVNLGNNTRETRTPSSDKEAASSHDDESDGKKRSILRRNSKKFSKEQIAEMSDMLINGSSTEEIAKAFNAKEIDVRMAIQENKFGTRLGDSIKGFGSSIMELFKRSGIEEGAKEIANSLTDTAKEVEVTEEDKQNLYNEMAEDVKQDASKYIPSMIGGGVVGAGVSLLTGAIGGPLLGAAIGAATDLAVHSHKVQDWLFGDYNEAGERKGNILSKELSNNIEKFLPSMAKSATVGGIMGILPFTPGGPVTGVILGSALGFAKKSDKVQKLIFGEEDDPDSGLLSQNTRNFLKAHVPEAVLGAAGGVILGGPFGLVGNMMVGGAFGFVSQTEQFKDALFGKVNEETGKREGGLIGVLRDGFVKPLTDFGKDIGSKAKNWLKDDIINPITRAFKPLFRQGENMAKAMLGWVGEGIGKVFSPVLGGGAKFFGQKIGHKAKTVLNVGKTIGEALARPAANTISAPFRVVGALGDHFRRKQIQNGTADYMTAEERNTYRDEMRDNVIYDKYDKDVYEKNENGEKVLAHRKGEIKKDQFGQRIVKKKMRHKLLSRTLNGRGTNSRHGLGRVIHPLDNPDKFEKFDRDLVNMNLDELNSMKESLSILGGDKKKVNSARDNAINNVNDLFTNQFADRLGWHNTKEIMKVLRHGDGSNASFNSAIKIINKAGLDETSRAALKNSFTQRFSEYQTISDLSKNNRDVKDQLYERLKKMGYTDISDKTLSKFQDKINQEIKVKKNMDPIDRLNESQDKRHKEIIDYFKEAIEAIQHINDPDYINKKRLKRYMSNANIASRTQGNFFFGLGDSGDIPLNGDTRINEEGKYVVTDENGEEHVIDQFGRDEETGDQVSAPRQNIFSTPARITRRVGAIARAPFRNFWRKTDRNIRTDISDFKFTRRMNKFADKAMDDMSVDELIDYLGDDAEDIINTDGFDELDDTAKKSLLKGKYGFRKASERTSYGLGKFLTKRKAKKRNKQLKKLRAMSNEELANFMDDNNVGDGLGELNDDNRESFIDLFSKKKEEEDTKTVSDFMGNPIEWTQNSEGQWIQKNTSRNKVINKLQDSALFSKFDGIFNKISDLTADVKDGLSRFFHLDEEDGWGKKILKIGAGVLGVLTVAGFMPILEGYWKDHLGPGLKGFWDNSIYPKISRFIEHIQPTIAKAAIGMDAAIRSIPSAIENLGNRIYGFIANDLPYIWSNKIIPFYQGGIDWIGEKVEKVFEGATTLLLNVAPHILKGVFKGVRNWWTRDLAEIFLHKNDMSSSMGNGTNSDTDDVNIKYEDSTSEGGPFETIYQSIFGKTAQSTLGINANTMDSNSSIDSELKKYYQGDDVTDYPYDDVRRASAGYSVNSGNSSSSAPKMNDNNSSNSNNTTTSTVNNATFGSYIRNVTDAYTSKGNGHTENNTVNSNSSSNNINATTNNKTVTKSTVKNTTTNTYNSGNTVYNPYNGTYETTGYVETAMPNIENTDTIGQFNNYGLNNKTESKTQQFINRVQNSYNKAANNIMADSVDRNGNSDIPEGTTGYLGKKGGICYFDYGFATDSGYVLNKDNITINYQNSLVYDKESGNFIPNIFYDTTTGKFTNIPTTAAENTYKNNMSQLGAETTNLPTTVEEMHDEELIYGYKKMGKNSLYKNATLLTQKDSKNNSYKVSDYKADLTKTSGSNKSNNSILGRYLGVGLRNTLFRPDKALEKGAKLSKFGGKLTKASLGALATGHVFKGASGTINGIGIKTLGLAYKLPAKAINKVKEKMGKGAAEQVIREATSEGAETAAKDVAKNTARNAGESTVESAIEKASREATTATEKTVISAIKSFPEKLKNCKFIKALFNKLMSHAGAKGVYETFCKKISDSIVMSALKGLKKGSASLLSRAAADLGTGGVAAIAFGVYDFTSGIKNAASYLGFTTKVFKSLPFWKRLALQFISGVTQCLLGIGFITCLIPPALVMNIVATPLYAMLNIDSEALQQMKDETAEEIAKYNKEHGTNYKNAEDFNKRNSLGTKVKNVVKSAWNSIKSGIKSFIGGDKTEEKNRKSNDKINDTMKNIYNSANNSKTSKAASSSYEENFNSNLSTLTKLKKVKNQSKSGKGSGLLNFSASGSGMNTEISSSNSILNKQRKKISKKTIEIDDNSSLLNHPHINNNYEEDSNDTDGYVYSSKSKSNIHTSAAKPKVKANTNDIILNIKRKKSNVNNAAQSNNISATPTNISGSGSKAASRRKKKSFISRAKYNIKNPISDSNNIPYFPAAKGSGLSSGYQVMGKTADGKDMYVNLKTGDIAKDSDGNTKPTAVKNNKKSNTKLGSKKVTKDDIYVENVTDTERSEYLIDDLIYCISVIESSASFGACGWESTSKGTIGVGIFQWRGDNAKKLLQSIAKIDSSSEDILGKDLYNTIIKKKNIKGKTLTNSEKNSIAKLLVTDTGKDFQLEKAHDQVVKMIKKAKKQWKNPKVILYWSMIYGYAPLVANDILSDNRLNPQVSLNQFFNVFSANYDLYSSDTTRWTRAYNLAMASPVWKVSDNKWNKSFVMSQMSVEYNELDEEDSNPITALFSALTKMGEAWFGLGKKNKTEADNISSSTYSDISSSMSDQVDPYTMAALEEYAKEADKEKHLLLTRLKYVKKMMDTDQTCAVKLIDQKCHNLLKLLKAVKEGKEYAALAEDDYKGKARIFKDINKLNKSVKSQLSKRCNNTSWIDDIYDISLKDNERLKSLTAFTYYYVAAGKQADAKLLSYKDGNDAHFKGVFNTNFVKNVLINSKSFIKSIKACANRTEAIKFLRNYKNKFLNDANNAEFIDDEDKMFADLTNAYANLGSNNSVSSKERSWDIAEAILSSYSDGERKVVINDLSKKYGVDDFNFMLRDDKKGNTGDLYSIFKASTIKNNKTAISFSEWKKKNKSKDYNKYVSEMKSLYDSNSPELTSDIQTMVGKYRGTRIYQTTNAANPYTITKNLEKGNLDLIDKIYEKPAREMTINGKKLGGSFKDAAKSLFKAITSTGTDFDTQADAQNYANAYGLLDDGAVMYGDQKQFYYAFKNYYKLWKKVPENVGGPFMMDNDINYNELMHYKTMYDVYNQRNKDLDKSKDKKKKDKVDKVPQTVIDRAKNQYDVNERLAMELMSDDGPIINVNNEQKAKSKLNTYLEEHYVGLDKDGKPKKTPTGGNDSYFATHYQKFATNKDELYGNKLNTETDGFDEDEIRWMQSADVARDMALKASLTGNVAADKNFIGPMPQNSFNALLNYKPISPSQNPYEYIYSNPGYEVPSTSMIVKLKSGMASEKEYEKYSDYCQANNITKLKTNDTSKFNDTGVPDDNNIVSSIADKVSKQRKNKSNKSIDPLTKLNNSNSGKGSGFVSQLDYADARFSDGESVAEAGCGPAVAAMAINNLQNKVAKGSDLMSATTAVANKYKDGGGTKASYFKDIMSKAGADTSYTNSSSEIKSDLKKGDQVVLMGRDASNKSKANSPFGPNNHYVLATGMGNGKVTINDPEQHAPKVYSDKILNKTKLGVSISGRGSGINKKINTDEYSAAGYVYQTSKITSKVEHEGVAAGAKKYKKTLEAACKHHGLSLEWIDLLLSIMTRESHGGGGDPMQAAEGDGNCKQGTKSGRVYPDGPNGITNPTDSCYAGVYELKAKLNQAGCKNPYDAKAILDIVQSYNFGGGYMSWLKKRGEHYTLKNAIEFGKMMSSKSGYLYGCPNYALRIWDTYKTTKSGKKAASGKYGDYEATATSGSSSSSGKKKSSDNSTWMEKLTNAINKSMNAFLGIKSNTGSTSIGSDGNVTGSVNGSWVDTVKTVKKAFAKAPFRYSLGGSGTISINGKKKKVRTDCTGFVCACLQEFGVNILIDSRGFLANNSTLSKAGFKKMKWSGWNSLKKGDIMAKDGHAEIFSHNQGGSHYVWNFGGSSSDTVPGTTRSAKSSYTAVWRAPADSTTGKKKSSKKKASTKKKSSSKKSNKKSAKGSGIQIRNNSPLFKFSAMGSDVDIKKYSDIDYYTADDNTNIYDIYDDVAKGSDISDSKVYNYLDNFDNETENTKDFNKSMYERKTYNKPAKSKAYKSINKYVKDNGIKLSSEVMDSTRKNANNSSMNDILKQASGKGSTPKKKKSSTAGVSNSSIPSTDKVISNSISYINNHNISGNGNDNDIKVLLHAILSLEAVTANNSYELNTIVSLLRKIVDEAKDKKVSKASSKSNTSSAKKSAKGSSIESSSVDNTVVNDYLNESAAQSIINNINNRSINSSSNMENDGGLSELINNLESVVSK